MPSDRVGIASAEYREVAEERLTENRETYPLAPFLEGRALKRYVKMKRRYQNVRARDGDGDLPSTFEGTKYCMNLVAGHGSRVARRAVAEGNLSMLSFLSGVIHRDSDFSSAELFSKLVHHLRRDGYMTLFLGGTDGGKTNTALLLAALHLRDNPDAVLVCNLEELDWGDPRLNNRTHYADSTSGVLEVAEEHQDVIALLDELSTSANAQTSGYDVNEHLYPLITAKSKHGLRIIGIGHREDGYDLAPPLREHADHIVRQVREVSDLGEDEYRAEFYEEVAEDGLAGHQFTLSPVPSVSATYNPDEQQSFSLDA